jgi:hypothetical protein
MAQTIHSYYFAEFSGNLLGIKPKTSTVVSIGGPFISFDKKTRILTNSEGQYYLPEDRAEKSKNPNLFEHTKEILNNLTHKTM